ncbi:hypothetical protein HW555_012647 [Spodoptera exigua]|uniref:Uncharacterized protein n=1 Tax=Spodoptera exigua TaxID=7107 RepID=A0A835G4I9_SPOEX|nr:hypothetical protein HW555_012647 [Spodoptera exigua]
MDLPRTLRQARRGGTRGVRAGPTPRRDQTPLEPPSHASPPLPILLRPHSTPENRTRQISFVTSPARPSNPARPPLQDKGGVSPLCVGGAQPARQASRAHAMPRFNAEHAQPERVQVPPPYAALHSSLTFASNKRSAMEDYIAVRQEYAAYVTLNPSMAYASSLKKCSSALPERAITCLVQLDSPFSKTPLEMGDTNGPNAITVVNIEVVPSTLCCEALEAHAQGWGGWPKSGGSQQPRTLCADTVVTRPICYEACYFHVPDFITLFWPAESISRRKYHSAYLIEITVSIFYSPGKYAYNTSSSL